MADKITKNLNVAKQKYSDIKTSNPEKLHEEYLQKQNIGKSETAESNVQQIRDDIKAQYEKEKSIANQHLEQIPKDKTLKINKNDKDFFNTEKIKSLRSNTESLDRLLNNFLKDPNFEEAHKFRSALGKVKQEMRESRQRGSTKYIDEDFEQINKIEYKLDEIIEKSLTKKQNQSWTDFKKKWSQDVVPYQEEPGIAKFLSKTKKVTPTDVQSTFEFTNPKGRVAKIVKELPKNTRDRIVYQKQIDKPIEDIPNIIRQAAKTKGLGKYIGEEDLQHAANLEKYLKNKELRDRLKSALYGGAAGAVIGKPFEGALAGFGKKEIMKLLTEILSKK